MDYFRVGGAVRDKILGIPNHDHDWVVVGSTPQEMLDQGFKLIGKDFPVFLHPETGDEYALARTERKTAPGYVGFAIHADADVTLEQDLARRDFTMNAIAEDLQGRRIDPFNGCEDIQNKIIRHVSDAFMEDPVRILRGARFAARFNFEIAPETMALMRTMVQNGEVDALVPERVWKEMSKGLMMDRPSRFIEVMRDSGALKKILPEVDVLFGIPQPEAHHPEIDTGIHVLLALDAAAKIGAPLDVRWAVLLHDVGKALTPQESWPAHHNHEGLGLQAVEAVCDRYQVSLDCKALALLVAEYHTEIHRFQDLRANTVIKLFQKIDAWRRPVKLDYVLQACKADAQGRLGREEEPYQSETFVRAAYEATLAVNQSEIAKQCEGRPLLIRDRIYQARISCVKQERAKVKPSKTLGL